MPSNQYSPALRTVTAVITVALTWCAVAPLPAQVVVSHDVFYVAGSARKIDQILGDFDEERQVPTINLTDTRAGFQGSDLGVSFDHTGVTHVVFGDVLGAGGLNARDPIAYTADRDPEDGIALTFITTNNIAGDPIFCPVATDGIPDADQEGMEVPLDGVSIGGQLYIFQNVKWIAATEEHTRSVVAVRTNDYCRFSLLHTLSTNHFRNVSVSLVNADDWPGLPYTNRDVIVYFGSGWYRKSDVRLACQPAADITNMATMRYFTGLDGAGQPQWATNESSAQALFIQGEVGELSGAYNRQIRRWLLLYNAGTPRGIHFRSARQPWGPWSVPKVLFDPFADGGYFNFMHWGFPPPLDTVQDGLSGAQDRWGGEYGPYMFKDLSVGSDNLTTLYFSLSTWNTYEAVLMRSTLTVTNVPEVVVHPDDQYVREGETADFSVAASAAGALYYFWQKNGSPVAGATASVYSIASAAPGDDGDLYRCVVSNSLGVTTSRAGRVAITTDQAPEPVIELPLPGATYTNGDLLAFFGTATDPEDGTLTASSLSWRITFHHSNHTVLAYGTAAGITNGAFRLPLRGETDTNVFYRVHLTAVDSQQRRATITRDIIPRTAMISLRSSPSGLPVKLDGISYLTPTSIPSVVGARRMLSAVLTTNFLGTNLDFMAWSDGGAPNHEITVPDHDLPWMVVWRPPTNLVATNATWRYAVTNKAPAVAWNRTSGYNENGWNIGPAQLGFGDGDEATVIGYGPDPNNKYTTTYFRCTFTNTNPAAFASLLVRVLRDDGAFAYLNSTSASNNMIYKGNMGGGASAYYLFALSEPSGAAETAFYVTNCSPLLLLSGKNVVAAEVHKSSTNNPDLSFALELRGVLLVRQAQAITFLNPGDQDVGAAVGLAASCDSGLPVSFAVGAGPGIISGGTNLTFSGTGVVSIVASQDGTPGFWDAALSVTNTFNVTGGFTLAVFSAQGGAVPAVGDHIYGGGAAVTAAVASPLIAGATQFVALGWAMNGNEPLAGTATEFVLTLTNNATLTWLWSTNYWLDTEAGAHGAVDVADGWQPAGSNVTLTAIPDRYYHFTNWAGDFASYLNPAEVTMDVPLSITGLFAPNLAALGTPEWWLATNSWTTNFNAAETNDHDRDGMRTWQEYVAGTLPNDPVSVLRIVEIVVAPGTNRLVWLGGDTSLPPFAVYRSTNLFIQGNGFEFADGVSRSASGTNTWSDPASIPPELPRYYLIRATNAP